MKANELMIGDWVKVLDFDTPDWSYCDKVIRLTKYFNNIEWYEPAPITEEILKANGFEKKQLDDSFIYSKEIGRYCIVFFSENGCPYLTIEDVEDIEQHHTCIELKDEVYNIHELQHALRLCGLQEFADNFKIH